MRRDDARATNEDEILLSVVINCYNYETYVRRAIESARAQNEPRCEIIVVDDGSTDGSWEIISSLGVRCFRKPNGGQVSACLYGVERTTAPFVMFLDADDELAPGSLSRIIAELDPNVAKLQFPLTMIDGEGVVTGPTFPVLTASRSRQGLVDCVETAGAYVSPPTSGNVFRRDVCSFLAGAQYDTAVDGVMLIAAPFLGDIVSLSEPLGYYRIHERNKSYKDRIPPTTHLRKHQQRFLSRVRHLRRALVERGIACNIADPQEMYIYARYNHHCDILDGKRVSLEDVAKAMRSLPKWYGPSRRISAVAFLCASVILPRFVNLHILKLRLTGGWRRFAIVPAIKSVGRASR